MKNTAIRVENCLFEDGFAGAKGGALLQEVGNITVLNSTFYNNSVGSSGTADGERTKVHMKLSCTSGNANVKFVSRTSCVAYTPRHLQLKYTRFWSFLVATFSWNECRHDRHSGR